MKHISWAIGLAVLVLAGSFWAADPPVAAAGGYYGGGGYHGGYYGGGGYHGGYYGDTRVYIGGGWWGGPGWWGAPYPYPYAGYPAPVVVQPTPPTEYIQQSAPAAQYWYYCSNPQGYYPYVTNCTVPWIPVPPQPAAAGVPQLTP